MNTTLILWAALGYLFGSVPFGLVLTRMVGINLREVGPGTIGATNVLRTGRKDLALATLVLDATKAGIVALVAKQCLPQDINVAASLLAGSMAVIGHNFPVWLKFRGGKGVASAFGFILFTSPVVGLSAFGVWLLMAFIFKYSSLAAIVACMSTPFFAFLFSGHDYAVAYSLIALLVLVRHHANIKRLINGTETKINLKKKGK